MCKILIFGTGSTAEIVTKSLKDNIDIIAYVDNDISKHFKKFNDKIIIPPQKIKEHEYDFIIIASQYNEEIYEQLNLLNISKNVIFQFFNFITLYDNSMKFKLNEYYDRKDNIEVIITGISYTVVGLKLDNFFRTSFSFARGSQDLFYDYNIIKHVMKRYNNAIKYCIIGLCYYSFQYDLSLSAMKSRVMCYYDFIKESHNFYNFKDYYIRFNIDNYIANEILSKNSTDRFVINWDVESKLNDKNINKYGKNQASVDCNKNYPETVKENKQIFKDYLKLLKDNNIKPIVVVFPASKYYTKYFSKRIEDEFHSIINEVKKEYDFQYIDYFRSELFDDEDFQDVSHLNSKGAEKFTNILNDTIEW